MISQDQLSKNIDDATDRLSKAYDNLSNAMSLRDVARLKYISEWFAKYNTQIGVLLDALSKINPELSVLASKMMWQGGFLRAGIPMRKIDDGYIYDFPGAQMSNGGHPTGFFPTGYGSTENQASELSSSFNLFQKESVPKSDGSGVMQTIYEYDPQFFYRLTSTTIMWAGQSNLFGSLMLAGSQGIYDPDTNEYYSLEFPYNEGAIKNLYVKNYLGGALADISLDYAVSNITAQTNNYLKDIIDEGQALYLDLLKKTRDAGLAFKEKIICEENLKQATNAFNTFPKRFIASKSSTFSDAVDALNAKQGEQFKETFLPAQPTLQASQVPPSAPAPVIIETRGTAPVETGSFNLSGLGEDTVASMSGALIGISIAALIFANRKKK